MKHLPFYFLLLILFTACLQEDDDTVCPALEVPTTGCIPLDDDFGQEAYAELLIGTWDLVRIYPGFISSEEAPCEVATPNISLFITFTEDGRASKSQGEDIVYLSDYRVDVTPCAVPPCPLALTFLDQDLEFAPTTICDQNILADGSRNVADTPARVFQRR